MKKEYTRINGMRIAYKCDMTSAVRQVIMYAIRGGYTGGCIGKTGWWIRAKYSL
jgi:hypothetical protein